ncbi:LCP family protein [Nocardioides sp. Kera G14]|uniref:LCP family protein n=1 Tax=Nocardioides sp. Kera G14 TaxID=2884264 RepID=UPI001D11809B|nr:LCP family protein [Nocardioides sp. Kera G14]UDY22762.1 LCP family protein [Nocardioides sp. Kera G14]
MSGGRATAAERAARVRFRRAVALLVMTLVVPGSAQLLAGNRRVGRIALRVWIGLLALVLGSVLLAAIDHSYAFWVASSPDVLAIMRFGLIALALAWAWLFLDAWRIGQPRAEGLALLLPHRRMVLGINVGLALLVAVPLFFGSHMVGVQRGLMVSMFSGTKVTGAHDGRFNILLLGGDEGAGRTGLRPDSMTIASIDAETGKTVLVGLPRNMSNFKFKPGSVMAEQFPDGWGGNGKYLNGLSTWAMDHTALFKGYKKPGVEATIEGVEGITGLDINYWAMVNMHGFHELVDAVGGVTINVRQDVPIGKTGEITGWIKAGTRKLSGEQVLWYSRSRATSDDYSRMARQKCVMGAMLSQLSPQTVLTHFSKIADASSSMVSTSIPSSEVGNFVSLALKAKKQKIATVSLVPPAIITSKPNEAKIRRMIAAAIDGKKATKKVAKPAGSTSTTTATDTESSSDPVITGGSIGSLKTGYAANQSDDLAASC